MSSDDPPNNYFNGIGYNPLFYAKDSVALTKTDGDTYYLSKQNSDTSTAPLTTFIGGVTIGTFGTSPSLRLITSLNMNDLGTNTGYFSQIYYSGQNTKYYSGQGASSTEHNFYTKNNIPTDVTSFSITSTQNISRIPLSLLDRLNFNPSSYSFPFSSNTSLGYYLKTTGTALSSGSYTSGTYVNLLTTSSIPIGVWRIDYSATNTVSGGGNITSANTLVSSTSASSTQVPFTGSSTRTHTTENYGTGDIHIVNGSFTYNQSIAGVLYLVFQRTYISGTYSWVGELSITRIS